MGFLVQQAENRTHMMLIRVMSFATMELKEET